MTRHQIEKSIHEMFPRSIRWLGLHEGSGYVGIGILLKWWTYFALTLWHNHVQRKLQTWAQLHGAAGIDYRISVSWANGDRPLWMRDILKEE